MGAMLLLLQLHVAQAGWLARLAAEQQVAVQGAHALKLMRWRNDPDVASLPAAMEAGYERMRKGAGGTVAAYPGYEQIELGDPAGAGGVVIFLHGFAGGFSLPCWQLAQAAAEVGMATVCPQLGWRGDWWSPNGRRIFEDSLARLRARGAKRIVLAGLSNGGVGASALAGRTRTKLDGLILISGQGRGAPSGVPTLVLYGRKDRHYPGARAARLVSLDGGHFAFLLERERAHAAIVKFLRSEVRHDVVEGVEGAIGH